MSIVAERVARVLRVGLDEEVERQTREDDARGPEAEECGIVTRLVLPGGYEWEARESNGAALPGGDELRVRALLNRLGVRL
ncbi:hypothetical protein JGS39_29110 [Streptomyces sp. P01-B04]|uniref:hypothetical protein n=1 Tax=Streptomyces poriferorum TaxID=2798799 RepID=UPI001C5D1FB6|nr:hypothetical protein [Streptomyces poriferorum]MBW5252988.1 hypothetical protein [Streptomyces poriferorum]MBW5261100.1 hypothetical protein [Streptomyces poriferorum]